MAFEHLSKMAQACTPKNGRINESHVLALSEKAKELKAFNYSDDSRINNLLESVAVSALNVKNWKVDEADRRALMSQLEGALRTTAEEIGANMDAYQVITRRHVRPTTESSEVAEEEDDSNSAAPIRRVSGGSTPTEEQVTLANGEDEPAQTGYVRRAHADSGVTESNE